jgi:16S rRNA (cytidine1402-2'-O)-methyltransferase
MSAQAGESFDRPAGAAAGTLYVVATPIGNLQDITLRALAVLGSVDLIAAEDTRMTSRLLDRHGIRVKLMSLHEHNESRRADEVATRLGEGLSVAYVTDAGTPALSDPGALLVEAAHHAGIRVSPVPGPSAAAAAFSAAGFAADRFLFAGFLPASAAARRRALEALEVDCPLVLYEAPHRILETVQDLAARFGPEREIVIGRELTKKFEEVARMKLGEARAWLLADPERIQGEFVLVLAAGEPKSSTEIDAERTLQALLEVMAPSEAARVAARITGQPRRLLYQKALRRAK